MTTTPIPTVTAWQAVLDEVPEADREVVSSAARIRLNCTGGRPSDAARAAVREYHEYGVAWLDAANAKDREIGRVR